MTLAGVAALARTGRLIDRFRDRAVLPIIRDGQVLGFVGRRHPQLSDNRRAVPKYLNTADTPLFHKGAQLYGALPRLRDPGVVPVLVEGPMDAIAVTLATGGSHVGVAPLGTSLTEEQARQLVSFGPAPVVATDGDPAGRLAAERAFWLIGQHGGDPTSIAFRDGADPAQVLAADGPASLASLLQTGRPLGQRILTQRLADLPGRGAVGAASAVAAVLPSDLWDVAVSNIAASTGFSTDQVRPALLEAARAWNADPRLGAQQQIAGLPNVRTRMGQRPTEPARRHTGTGFSDRLAARARVEERLTRVGGVDRSADRHGR